MQQENSWSDLQRRYYEDRQHTYLQPGQGGLYARKIAQNLSERIGLPTTAHGLEIGCGAGRFTIPLLEHFESLSVIDLSDRQLGLLSGELEREGIDAQRCSLNRGDIDQADQMFPAGHFDFVVGVFVLHHLQDAGQSIQTLAKLVKPGGRAVFLEPNRWNPLFTLQILFLKDISYQEEKMMYRLSAKRLRQFFGDAGLVDVEIDRNGFFPPQILNRFSSALAIEHRLEKSRILNPLLPFQLVRGTQPDRPAASI